MAELIKKFLIMIITLSMLGCGVTEPTKKIVEEALKSAKLI